MLTMRAPRKAAEYFKDRDPDTAITEALNAHLEIEALHIGDSEIGGATLEVSTNDTELAGRILYLAELATSIVATKGRSHYEQSNTES